MALREVAAKLGVDVDSKKLESFMGSVDAAKEKLAALGAAFLGSQFVSFVNSQIEATAAIAGMAAKMSVSTDEAQKLAFALGRIGLDSDKATKAMVMFNKAIGDDSVNAGTKFAKLGIKIKDGNGAIKPTSEILGDVADRIQKTGNVAEATAIAMQLFGEDAKDMVPLLMQGRAGLKSLTDEFEAMGGVISGDTIKQAKEVRKEVKSIKFALETLTNNAIAPLLPYIKAVIKVGSGWAGSLSKLVKTSNVLQVALITLGAIAAVKLVPMLFQTARTFFSMQTAIMGVTGPTWLWIAALAFLFLVFEDLFTLVTGGDSLIGTLLDKFGGLGTKEKVITALKDAWKLIVDVWTDAKTAFNDIVKAWEAGEGVLGGIKAAIKIVMDAIDALVKKYEQLTGGIKSNTKVYTGAEADAKLKGYAANGTQVFTGDDVAKKLGEFPKQPAFSGTVAGNSFTVPAKLPTPGGATDSAPVIQDNSSKQVVINASQLSKDEAEKLVQGEVKKAMDKGNAKTWHAQPGFAK